MGDTGFCSDSDTCGPQHTVSPTRAAALILSELKLACVRPWLLGVWGQEELVGARACVCMCVCVVGEADLNIKGSSRKDR